ncbi:hypothetical protein BCR43DRAFT_483959 [Syncephalastrum racemosum]|uniref:GSKIP domain-containing protein n=1 Tax=Syncephalastrum racemosum TaxID=13706 RepID=A0A1X2HW00_SYNRA|nr:hypothetical protein BCR43DRAFT_483959 [Syncephalastrum racemosum]
MRQSSLSAELEAITHEYDYGIVPGSATVFVQDEENNLGRLEMTLLESVLIIVDVTDQGFAVMSCAPLTSSSLAIATAQNVQAHVTKNFESMESLLITLSPLFCQRFQDTLFSKLQGVQNEQQQQEQQQQQQQQAQEPSSSLSTANTVTPEQTLSSVGPATDNPHNPQHIFPPASISSQTTSNIPSHDPTDQLLNPSTTTTHTDHQLIPEEELLKQWLQ